MAAVSGTALRERNGDGGPEGAPIGLLWLKLDQRHVVPSGLRGASGDARVHQGRERPAGGEPSAVVCFPSAEEDGGTEVEGARALAPNSVVLVFAPSPSLRLARAALGAGASGLLGAGMRPEQVLRAVGAALRGETVLPRGLLSEWVDEQRPLDLGALLSARQREVLGLVAEGATNVKICRRLYLSESTVKQDLRAAYKALGVRNRREAVAHWRRYRRGCV